MNRSEELEYAIEARKQELARAHSGYLSKKSELQAQIKKSNDEYIATENRLNHEIRELKKELLTIPTMLESCDLEVSDHALVRYLERVENIDVSSIRKKIISEITDTGKVLKTSLPLTFNRFVIKAGRVVTVNPS